MSFRKYIKNKKVVATIVISLLLIFTSTIKTHANENSRMENSNSIKIENSIKQQKEIGIKRRLTTVSNESIKSIKGKRMKVTASAYTGAPEEGGEYTYIDTKCIEGYTIAVDPEVIPLRSKVYIPQFGKVFVAEDVGSAIKGNRIDIFMNDYDDAMEWGLREIDIIVLD